MARYRLYYLREAMLTGSDEIEAANDVEASRLGKARAVDRTVELWLGSRRVRTIVPLKPDRPRPTP